MYQRLYLRPYLRFDFGLRGRVRPSLLLLSAALPAAGSAAIAQEVVELPPVVVEGATLEAPNKSKNRSSSGAATSPAPSAATAGANTGSGTAETSGIENGIPASQVGSAVTVVTGATRCWEKCGTGKMRTGSTSRGCVLYACCRPLAATSTSTFKSKSTHSFS